MHLNVLENVFTHTWNILDLDRKALKNTLAVIIKRAEFLSIFNPVGFIKYDVCHILA